METAEYYFLLDIKSLLRIFFLITVVMITQHTSHKTSCEIRSLSLVAVLGRGSREINFVQLLVSTDSHEKSQL